MRTTLLFLLISFSSIAQFGFERSNHIPVIKNGTLQNMPWAGGLNYGQLSEIDMNFDGRMDLFLFDRSENQIRIFLSLNDGEGDYFIEAPEYRFSFPSDVRYRAALVDFNQDGFPDIFTYGIGGLKVYRNVGTSEIGHQWEVEKNLLYSNYFGTIGNLYVSSSDIPAITDVDGDGDIDILTFHIGGERLEYHKNMSMENYGVPDSLEFVLMNECWGNFREDANTNSILLNNNISPCGEAGGNIPDPQRNDMENRHAGSTVLAIDMNGSGVKDIILGDISFTNLVLLMNGGTEPNTNSTMISVDYNFPSNSTPSSLSLFPAGFYVDADHDNTKDLLVTPSAKIVSENQRSIWRYKNIGTNDSPVFVFQENDFLQNQMIDCGSMSIPVIVDVNGDGLKDLLVANLFNYKAPLNKESQLTYYQNTGTSNEPVFTFVEENKFGLTALQLGLRLIPTFGDIDGDGDLDMILGAENGRIHLFTNTAGTGNSMTFSTPQLNIKDAQGFEINVGSFSAPFVVDLNRDGLLDLVIGTKNGTIYYYENTGTSEVPEFTLITSQLGNVNVSASSPDGFAVPHFVDIEGIWHLFIGARNGKMHYYTEIESNLESGQSFALQTSNYAFIDVAGYSSFWIEDVNNNGFLELFVGTDLGGVELYEADPNSTIGFTEFNKENSFFIFPNPSSTSIQIKGIQSNDELTIFNQIGNEVSKEHIQSENTTISIEHLTTGLYFITIKRQGKTTTLKLVKK
jgi:hypothetical protein